jgi:hypothetical protein
MGKAGEKQKRRPKIKDKKQSERFKEAAQEAGADEDTDAFAAIEEVDPDAAVDNNHTVPRPLRLRARLPR